MEFLNENLQSDTDIYGNEMGYQQQVPVQQPVFHCFTDSDYQ